MVWTQAGRAWGWVGLAVDGTPGTRVVPQSVQKLSTGVSTPFRVFHRVFHRCVWASDGCCDAVTGGSVVGFSATC
jgi:hypothetical protein